MRNTLWLFTGGAILEDMVANGIDSSVRSEVMIAGVVGLNPRITVEPGKMGGKPCIRGLRFTVYDLAAYLASGMTEDEILKDFPYLEKEDFQAVYEFFASIPERIAVLEASR
jgi:uncharacterized protein (DUF433 family)